MYHQIMLLFYEFECWLRMQKLTLELTYNKVLRYIHLFVCMYG